MARNIVHQIIIFILTFIPYSIIIQDDWYTVYFLFLRCPKQGGCVSVFRYAFKRNDLACIPIGIAMICFFVIIATWLALIVSIKYPYFINIAADLVLIMSAMAVGTHNGSYPCRSTEPKYTLLPLCLFVTCIYKTVAHYQQAKSS